MRSDLERMRDIREAIANIEKYAIRGKTEFLAGVLIQGWILLQLQIIGEAARSMSVQTREKHSQINWQDIIDFRGFASSRILSSRFTNYLANNRARNTNLKTAN